MSCSCYSWLFIYNIFLLNVALLAIVFVILRFYDHIYNEFVNIFQIEGFLVRLI